MGLCDVTERKDVQPARTCFPVDRSEDTKDQGYSEGIGVFGEFRAREAYSMTGT